MGASFSEMSSGQRYDVIVIGGGINGVAIARECALAGKRTLIVEQHDFGWGTTSRSTRIIHGGLRYLEHGEIGLVRQSLRERQRLLAQRSNLVRPMNFLLALPADGAGVRHSALEIRAALWLYRRMAGDTGASSPEQDVARLERLLDQGRHWSLFNYEDAQCEFPERLVAEWLSEALVAGAVARNYSEVLEIVVRGGRARGVRLRHCLTGEEIQVEANWIINATGPWGDILCTRSRINTGKRMIGGARGTHLLVQRFPGAPNAAIYAEAVDGRPIFVIPWNGQLMVGTTEVRDSGDPSMSRPEREEIAYLFESLCRCLPNAEISWSDVNCAFSGIRPLPYSPGHEPSGITRRHLLRDHADDGAMGVISVVGGKLTTAAALARECARKIGFAIPEPPSALVVPASGDGVEGALQSWAQIVGDRAGISVASARAMAEWFGGRALRLAQLARTNPLLRESLCPHTHHLVAEAMEASQSEMAIALADILLRRVPVALGACWSEQCTRHAAAHIGVALGWTQYHIQSQVEQFEVERQQFLREPGSQPVRYAEPSQAA
ncbi:MAG TPA: glycerol-3-phosphate dehydrogenase/oxidase [Bryobacteraceae bacterium]